MADRDKSLVISCRPGVFQEDCRAVRGRIHTCAGARARVREVLPPDSRVEQQGCPADHDRDADGIPDRCDTCPFEPGMVWDDFPSIDGCPTGVFHSLVREPEGTILRISYQPNSHEPPQAGFDELLGVLEDTSIDSIALVGHAARSERDPGALALRRARRMADALVARGVRARMVTYAASTDASAIDVAVLSRNGQEELRWMGDRLEHVRAAAARAAKERARSQPSPCGRMPGTRTPPPPTQ
jgi:hypothetical protein